MKRMPFILLLQVPIWGRRVLHVTILINRA